VKKRMTRSIDGWRVREEAARKKLARAWEGEADTLYDYL
jgi:hypothetical protein